jgi:uncharacterized protein YukE
VSDLVPGDPASLSSLAAALVRCAELLADRRTTLSQVESQLQPWSGPSGESFRDVLAAHVRVVEESAEAIRTCAAALQRFAVDLQHARALALEAERYCHEHGLHLGADGDVRMPWGAYSVEEAQGFADHLPWAQRLCQEARGEAEESARRLDRQVGDPVHRLQVAARATSAGVAVSAVPG